MSTGKSEGSANGWRPEDDASCPKGWTWKRACQECFGMMPIDEPGDFCCDDCEQQYDAEISDEDEP